MLLSSDLTNNNNIEWKMMMKQEMKMKLMTEDNEYIILKYQIFSIDKARTVKHNISQENL